MKKGGPATFQGMPWELTTRNILTDFISKLEAMPWSVSKVSDQTLRISCSVSDCKILPILDLQLRPVKTSGRRGFSVA